MVNDRFEYGVQVSESWKRQTLLNLVRLRYGDTPVFLDVASIINSSSLAGSLNAGAVLSPYYHPGATFPFGAQGSWSSTPTICYVPVSGEKFATHLLKPISPVLVFELMQAGWPPDLIFRLVVRSVNGITNGEADAPGGSSRGPDDFSQMMAALERGFRDGSLGLRLQEGKGGDTGVLMIRPKADQTMEPGIGFLRQRWNLDPAVNDINITFGNAPQSTKELALVTRSMLDTLLVLAAEMDVPADDLAANRALPGLKTTFAGQTAPLLTIHSGRSAPGKTYAAVPYQDGWFWIEDNDVATKCRFSFLMILASLATDSGAQSGAPLLTVPSR